ncbi:glucosidase 2 subunit beta [Halyomorpha halys]|uniref:glucosidase 2 subunit beta n=1 Tax=Halyomorpha halys TaxID=286706 RepID=UPI0006D51082|nr:glucosidase 2 subunit beta-like [Halyomorpha halys]
MPNLAKSFYIFNILAFGACNILRGVPIHRASLYDPSKDFFCLDGSISIPFTYVNDDFCDCLDGSDEPGTSACPNGTFHCENRGYIAEYIPSSRVNDGYCDCCDASDEYLTNKCFDVCDKLGLEARRAAERYAQMLSHGSNMRLLMIAAGKRIVQEKQERLGTLENEKGEAIKVRDEKETLKKAVEEQEFAAVSSFNAKEEEIRALKAQDEKEQEEKEVKTLFDNFDSDKDGRLQIEEIRTRVMFDQNKDGAVSDDEVKFFFDTYVEVSQNEFLEIVWPKLKPIYLLDKVKFIPPQQGEHEGNNDIRPDDETVSSENHDDLDADIANEHDGGEEEEEEEPSHDDFKDNAGNAQPQYDEATSKIVEDANLARSEYDKALRVYQDIDREITQLKESLSKDYGSEDEFAPLDGQCFSLTDRDYVYKICPFDQVTQAAKSGSSETRLGTWAGWLDQDYSVMFYDKGQSCWNGPQRSAKVNITCGLENEVLSAHEPNKCEYVLEFQTPAACRLPDNSNELHDEL